jgi:hypothetical protein
MAIYSLNVQTYVNERCRNLISCEARQIHHYFITHTCKPVQLQSSKTLQKINSQHELCFTLPLIIHIIFYHYAKTKSS